MLMTKARPLYLTDLVTENSHDIDQRKLFITVNPLLSDSKLLSMPLNVNSEVAANNIGNYFAQKVSDTYYHLAKKQHKHYRIPR